MTNQIYCDIIRDLMPQVIDGVASQASVDAVKKHLESCPMCDACYRDMQKAPPVLPVVADDITVRQAMRRIARSFTLRRILTIVMVLILLAGAVFAIHPIKDHFLHHFDLNTPLSEISAELSVTSRGTVILTTTATGKDICHSTSMEYDEESKTILFMPIRPRIVTNPDHQMDRDTDLFYAARQMIYHDAEYNGSRYDEKTSRWVSNMEVRNLPVDRILFGTWEENVVLYEAGDVVPPCSTEMEFKYTGTMGGKEN